MLNGKYITLSTLKHQKNCSCFCTDMSSMHAIILLCFLYQHVDELSEGLVWASRKGCLEDVVFLLSTEVEVNTRGQVRESDTVRSMHIMTTVVCMLLH